MAGEDVVRSVLDRALTSEKARRYYLTFYNVIRKYWGGLQELDLTSLVQEAVDLIDSTLSDRENAKRIEEFIRSYALGLVSGGAQLEGPLEEEGPEKETVDRIASIIEDLKKLKARVVELARERDAIVAKMNSLLYQKGWVERKWVKNKVGKKYYYYYYLRYYDNGAKRSAYLGKEVPKELERKLENYRELKRLYRELRKVERELRTIERVVDRIDSLLLEVVG